MLKAEIEKYIEELKYRQTCNNQPELNQTSKAKAHVYGICVEELKKIIDNTEVTDMEGEFKKGDAVTCLLNGKGIVENVTDDERYPVRAKFGSGFLEPYTKDGRIDADQDLGWKHLYHGHNIKVNVERE